MTEALCVTCAVLRSKRDTRPPNHPKRPAVCDWCRERLASDLAALPVAYGSLDIDPVRGVTEIRSRVFESKPPVNIDALSLMGPGSETPTPMLDFWVQDWAKMLDQDLPWPIVADLCSWLGARLEWACDQHPAIDDFATDIRKLARELHAYDNRDQGEPVGRCPRLHGDDHCNTPLYVDPYVDEIECKRCHTKWKRREGGWMHLRAQQIGARVEAAA